VAVSALRVYLYRNCLALCAGTKYRNDNHYTNLSAHITNTAFQVKNDTHFNDGLCVLQWNENDIAPILVRDGTLDSINLAREAVKSSIDKIGDITGELFRAYKGEIGVFEPIDGCFEHYGLDFLVDEEWNVFLLEVNPGPDFKQTGDKLGSLIEDLMGCTVDVALLPHVMYRPFDDDLFKLVYKQ
jgi:tubulin---tyrosine ligase